MTRLHGSHLDVIPMSCYHAGMAHLTVHIPDELLDRARALDPGANTSQLVQRGLERLSPAEDAAYAHRPDDAAELLAAAAGKIRDGAAREYEKDYRAALVMVSKAGDVVWPGLDDLARTGFDLPRRAEAWRRGLSPEEGRFQAAGLVSAVPRRSRDPARSRRLRPVEIHPIGAVHRRLAGRSA